MKFSYRWLKDLSGTKKTAPELAEMLIRHAFEVESIESTESRVESVVIGRVLSLRKHPQADRLRIAQVELGKGKKQEIVCGAPNIAPGQKVAVALPGTLLPGGRRIEEANIRGTVSRGMVCSAKELGLGEDQSGILVLSAQAPLGASLSEHLGLADQVLDIKILPDRASDALSYLGIAREIAALEKRTWPVRKESQGIKLKKHKSLPKIKIADSPGCSRYIGLLFQNVAIKPSPPSLKRKLLVSGLKPINSVVDATNYLMLLSGQPMHAFDADRLEGGISVRKAKRDEQIFLLNGEMKVLTEEDLVIADNKKAVGLAGIMGGAEASVTEKTKNVFLEIANFDSAAIRRTRIRHRLLSDASYRFERSLDPNLAGENVREAISLLTELSGGIFQGGQDVYPKPVKEWKIVLPTNLVNGILGESLPFTQMMASLRYLGFGVKKMSGQKLAVTVPTRRHDVRDPWDLVEEIGRLHGYEKIEAKAPLLPLVPIKRNAFKAFERKAKEYLSHAGFDEIMTYSFYGEREAKSARLPLSHHLGLANPLSPDQKLMRLNQIPLMLRKVRENLRYFDSFDIFEWGSAFGRNPETGAISEVKSLCLMSILSRKEKQPFFLIKGKTEAFLEALGIDRGRITYEEPARFAKIPVLAMLHPARSVVIAADGEMIGMMGEFHPEVLQAFHLEPRLAMAGFIAEKLVKLQKKEKIFRPLQKYPYAMRDISLVLPKKVSYREVVRLLREAGKPLLQKFELFDVYDQGQEKNLAFHLSFGLKDRTISSKEMDQIFDKIVAQTKQKLKGKLRQTRIDEK